MHLSEDVAVVEVVDRDNRAVAAGEQGAKVLLTVVGNTVQPLIRYEVTDEVTLLEGDGGELIASSASTRGGRLRRSV